jgi:2-oxo-4-hydroxy-4-carboxy-5-ureidoimidazoline decarboxylase
MKAEFHEMTARRKPRMDTPTANDRISLTALNALPREEFTAVLRNVLEKSPHFLERAWVARPFGSIADLHCAIMDMVSASTPEERMALLCAHPELGDRQGGFSSMWHREQHKAGLNDLTSDEVAQFKNLNAEYRQKHGFPFIICARLNSKRTILAAFARRLWKPREVELQTALQQVSKIARLRLSDIVTE